MIISTTASEPFEKVFIDVVGPLTRTLDGNAYILTMQCDLTKFSIAIPMANNESNTVAYHFVTSFVCIHGMPQSLVSDQGTEFLSRVFTETCKLIGIKSSTTSPYHPQANGALERSHRTLGEYLRHYVDVNQQNWDSYVPYAMFVYNSSVHSSTGKQPYELLYGKTLLVPNSLTKAPDARYNYDNYQTELKQKLRESHQIARERLIQKKQKTKFDYDQTAHSVDIHVGDRVLLQDKARKGKLSAKWLGPYEVLELNCNDDVTILRVKRGLFNAVGRVSKVLFGVCSDEDAEFLNSKISKLSNARTDTLNILEAQTRIVRATVTDINSTLTAISKERKNMGDLVTHLSEKLRKSLSALSELDAREMLSEQVTGISLLLTQQAFGIQKLLHIVNSAIHGQAHPSLMTHRQYVEHLREIQLTLPIGSNLPFPLEKFSITKFIQVTQVAILLANNTLIFILKIPLISSNSYKGYRLIPFPVRQQGETYSIFSSVPSVLALSSNREYFIPLTESQLGNCKRIDTSLYCSQITCMYSSTNTICGVNSLLGLKENSSVCKVQYVKITNSIFSRLESTNTWLYVLVSENVAIKCDNEDPHNIILNGTGQLTLNPQCVLYAKQTIFFPSQTIVRNSSQNLYNINPIHL
ncbi:hypothetical protein QTP88_018950 [Uroleucon formosanum]